MNEYAAIARHNGKCAECNKSFLDSCVHARALIRTQRTACSLIGRLCGHCHRRWSRASGGCWLQSAVILVNCYESNEEAGTRACRATELEGNAVRARNAHSCVRSVMTRHARVFVHHQILFLGL